jgi:hypothetical protein
MKKEKRNCTLHSFSTSALWFISLVFALSIQGCKHETKNLSKLPTVCFQQDILPIFQANCAIEGCHAAVGGEVMDLSTYSAISSGVTPFKPHESSIYQVITNHAEEMMPPPPKDVLSQQQRTSIYIWILQGAEDLPCDTIPGS